MRLNRAAGGQTFGVRHLQALLLFLGLTLAYAMRVNLSVAIVAITDKKAANPEFTVSNSPIAPFAIARRANSVGFIMQFHEFQTIGAQMG